MTDVNGANQPPASTQGHAAGGDDCHGPHGDRRCRWLVLTTSNRAVRNCGVTGGMSTGEWRRLERRARASHDEDTLSAARRLAGVLDVVVQTSATEVLCLRGGAWQLGLAGAMVPAWLHGTRCRLDAAGRYGARWWVRLVVGTRTVTILGSHLRVAPVFANRE